MSGCVVNQRWWPPSAQTSLNNLQHMRVWFRVLARTSSGDVAWMMTAHDRLAEADRTGACTTSGVSREGPVSGEYICRNGRPSGSAIFIGIHWSKTLVEYLVRYASRIYSSDTSIGYVDRITQKYFGSNSGFIVSFFAN